MLAMSQFTSNLAKKKLSKIKNPENGIRFACKLS